MSHARLELEVPASELVEWKAYFTVKGELREEMREEAKHAR